MTTPCDRRTALHALGGIAALWLPTACRTGRTTPGDPVMTHDDPTAQHSRMYDALAGHVTRGVVPGLIALVARRGIAEV